MSAEKKIIVQQLIVSDPEFLQALKIELTLKKQLATFKQPLPLTVMDRVYANITQQRVTAIYEQFLNY